MRIDPCSLCVSNLAFGIILKYRLACDQSLPQAQRITRPAKGYEADPGPRGVIDAYCSVKKVSTTLPLSLTRQTKRLGLSLFSRWR